MPGQHKRVDLLSDDPTTEEDLSGSGGYVYRPGLDANPAPLGFNPPSAGGMGNEEGLPQAHRELLDRVFGGLQATEDQGQQGRQAAERFHAQFLASQQPPEEGGLWQGMKDAGSKGLDLLGQGLNAITPSQDRVNDIAMRFQNAHAIGTGQLPMYMQMQQAQQQMGQQREGLELRRQQLAQHLEGIQEQKRHHNMQVMENLLATGNLEALKEFGKEYPPAAVLAKATNEADMMEIPSYIEKGWLSKQEVDDFYSGKWTPNKAKVRLGQLRKRGEIVAKHEAETADLREALNGDYNGLDAYHRSLVDDYKAKTDLTKAKTGETDSQNDERKAHAEWLRKQVEMGPEEKHPDRSEINRVALAMTGKPFDQLPPGGPEQKRAINEHASRYAQARQNVQFDAPISQKERSNLYSIKGLESLKLDRAPVGITERSARQGEFTHLDEKDEKAVTEFNVAKTTASTLFKTAKHLITAEDPLSASIQRGKLEAGAFTGLDGVAAGYKANKEAFASRMARLVEVGVLTQGDVDRWARTFPTFGDTKQSIQGKQALFSEIQNEAERLLKMKLTGKEGEKKRSKLDALLGKAEGMGEKALQEEYLETRTTKDGRKLGKTKDGRIVEIK
jgi:hypothetical protein